MIEDDDTISVDAEAAEALAELELTAVFEEIDDSEVVVGAAIEVESCGIIR